jgi:hypothetical protein
MLVTAVVLWRLWHGKVVTQSDQHSTQTMLQENIFDEYYISISHFFSPFSIFFPEKRTNLGVRFMI